MWAFFSRDAAKDFAYELGEEVEGVVYHSIWRLHHGKKKSSGDAVSIFVFQLMSPDYQPYLEVAKRALKRIKTLRHPSILTYVDSLETDKLIYLVVEPVQPLGLHLVNNNYSSAQKLLAISWGLHEIATGISFLNKDCRLSHNNICMPAVFVDRAGEWRLFGMEFVGPSPGRAPIKILPSLKKYDPPEFCIAKRSSAPNSWSNDSWGLGCLIWEVFNSPMKLTTIRSLETIEKIPSDLISSYCELVYDKPKSRPSSITFLEDGSKPEGFFRNKFVKTMLFLREIHIKENEEKMKFFNDLSTVLDTFPQDICLYKVLPELVNAFEFGNAGSSVLSPMFKLGKLLSEEEYQKIIVPCIVKMFSSKDRATRVKLLQQMEQFIDHIQPTVVNNQIFPNIAQGFMDTNPTIRDHTIKCTLILAPKLNYQNLNEEMLKHFARLQSKDEQGGIRTNTTVCLGKIASYLHPQTRKKVLISAFLRALRDPFPPARSAAILAFSATENYYSINDCATKVIPALSHFTVDPEKSIRDQAFKAIGGFLRKLEKVSEDPSLAEKMEEELQSTTPSSVAASWTSWAVTSLTDKLYKSSAKTQTPAVDKTQKSPSPQKQKEPAQPVEVVSESEQSNKRDSWNATEWEDANESINENARSPITETKGTGNDWDAEWENFEPIESFSNNVKSQESQKISSYFPIETEDPFSPVKRTSPKESGLSPDGWDVDQSWESWQDNDTKSESVTKSNSESQSSKQEANRIEREERRKQRLIERQLKPKKLGAQKIS